MSWEPDDVTPNDWKLKVKITCEDCYGIGWWETGPGENEKCSVCDGKGFHLKEVHPKGIEEFLARRESIDFRCICGKVEKILRPREGQIPSGWICWDSNYICGNCKYKVMLAAFQAVANKIQQIKETV